MKWLSKIVLAVFLMMTASSGAMAAAPTAAETGRGAPAAASVSQRAAATHSAQELAAREQQANAKGLPDFEGGEGAGLYIGGSALTVVLLIVLLVILL